MKCHGCGHEFLNKAGRCPRCHRATSKRGRPAEESRLLEFPRRPRLVTSTEPTAPSLPAWRIELNEKVRAIREKRVASNLETASAQGIEAAQETTRISSASNQQTAPSRRTSDSIVEAALSRVRRASEHASRAALPKIEPVKSIPSGSPVSVVADRQATARALAPAPQAEVEPASRPEVVSPPIMKPQSRRFDSSVSDTSNDEGAAQYPSVLAIDEIDPLDYLEAEIRKVDRALGAEFLRNESPSIFTHAVIALVDLVVLAATCAPFLAIIKIACGSLVSAQTRLGSALIVALLSFFYLALTQCLCGRTFGMMLTNTRVVDAVSFESPPPLQALLRTAGYFIAAAPAMLGFVWAAFNRKHRGWQDFFSGTMVVRDF
jgi:uncharacterized RDD family membrane protein YckC